MFLHTYTPRGLLFQLNHIHLSDQDQTQILWIKDCEYNATWIRCVINQMKTTSDNSCGFWMMLRWAPVEFKPGYSMWVKTTQPTCLTVFLTSLSMRRDWGNKVLMQSSEPLKLTMNFTIEPSGPLGEERMQSFCFCPTHREMKALV